MLGLMLRQGAKGPEVMQGWEEDRALFLHSNSLIRVVTTAVSVSLLAAAGVLLVEAQGRPHPLFQVPATLLTALLGAVALYAGSLAIAGRRLAALAAWSACLALLVIMPLLQVMPIQYDTPALLDIQSLAPPLWPYSLAIPLLLFLLLETSLPGRKSNHTSNLFLVLGLLSAVMLLYFSAALIGSVANRSTLILIPQRLFLSVLAPIGISGLMVVATVLPRKGTVLEGIALLVIVGLGVEWMSTWSYDGPHFLREAAWLPYPQFPLLPILAGTVPGALATLAGLLAGWEVYGRHRREAIPDPLPESDS